MSSRAIGDPVPPWVPDEPAVLLRDDEESRERLAMAEHTADSRVPCVWRKEPFRKCFMVEQHRDRADAIIAELRGEA